MDRSAKIDVRMLRLAIGLDYMRENSTEDYQEDYRKEWPLRISKINPAPNGIKDKG